MDFKRLTKATFIGEETAGKPNHFGEVKNLQLPESKLYVMYSTKYFKRAKKETNTIKPDVPIEMSFSDFTKGIVRSRMVQNVIKTIPAISRRDFSFHSVQPLRRTFEGSHF